MTDLRSEVKIGAFVGDSGDFEPLTENLLTLASTVSSSRIEVGNPRFNSVSDSRNNAFTLLSINRRKRIKVVR
jgi:hypothetical protein